MTREKEMELLKAFTEHGCPDARSQLIEAAYYRSKYLASGYTRATKFLEFEDFMQSSVEWISKYLDNFKFKGNNSFLNSMTAWARKGMRKELYTKNNPIYIPKHIINKGKAHDLFDHHFEGFDSADMDALKNADEHLKSIGLREEIFDIFDECLTIEEEDVIRLHFGFPPRDEDVPWDAATRAMSPTMISKHFNMKLGVVKKVIASAMEKLTSEENKEKLVKFIR